MPLLSDKPIEAAKQDELGTAAFVRRLLGPLLSWPLHDGLVLALYGAWGQGKSSALNLLESALIDRTDPTMPRAICVRFNPWLYRNAEGLLLSFFGALTGAVGHADFLNRIKRWKVQRALKLLGDPAMLALVSGHPYLAAGLKIASVAEDVINGRKNLLDQKKKAAEALLRLRTRSAPARVVVLMDDLDRLDDDEIRIVMQLVKLLADLPNMSYVLAMDHDRVAQVLSEHRNQEYGRSFLEKIVQIPVYLPPVSPDRLRALVEEGLFEIVPTLKRELPRPREWWSNFSDPLDYDGILGRRIRTLRDRARFLNNLRFLVSSGDQRLDVNAHDMVLISFLQSFFPGIYERVKRNKLLLTGDLPFLELVQAQGMTPDQRQTAQTRVVNKLLTGVSEIDTSDQLGRTLKSIGLDDDEYQTAKKVVERLFPAGVNGLQPTSLQAADDRRHHRIRSPEYFDRYFQLQPPVDEPSDEEVDSFIAGCAALAGEEVQKVSQATAENLLRPFIPKRTHAVSKAFVRKLRDRIGTMDPLISPSLALLVGLGEKLIEEDDFFFIAHDLAARASATPVRGTRSLSLDSRTDLTLRTIRAAVNSAPDAALAVRLAADFAKRERAEYALSDEARREIAQAGIERIAVYLASGADLFEDLGMHRAGEVLWRWRDLETVTQAEPSRIASYLHDLLRNHSARLPDILSLAAGWSAAGPTFDHRPSIEVRASLDLVFGSEELLQLSKSFKTGDQSAEPFGLVGQYLELMSKGSSTE